MSLAESLCTPWEALHTVKFTARTLQHQRAFGAGTGHASLDLFLGILGALGRDQGGTWYGTSAKPERNFTKGMFGKP